MTRVSPSRVERLRMKRLYGKAGRAVGRHSQKMDALRKAHKKGVEAGGMLLKRAGQRSGCDSEDTAENGGHTQAKVMAGKEGSTGRQAVSGDGLAAGAATGADVPETAEQQPVSDDGGREGPMTGAGRDAADTRGRLLCVDGALISQEKALRLIYDWKMNRHCAQIPPDGDWRTWLLMGGRGSGKTRAGAEWVHALATASGRRSDLRIALVAETLGDAREVMIDGVSGICRIARDRRPDFEASRRRLVWPNGAMAQIFSSEDPESLRGPQFHHAWCDELGKWKHADETFDMLQFGLRLGDRPRVLVTTTPRPVPLLKRLLSEAGTVTRRIATADNAKNLSAGFLSAMRERYGGTRLGGQELDGEMIAARTGCGNAR